MKDNDFGLIIGAGLEFGKLSVDLRNNLGISKIEKGNLTDIKNKVISLMVGFTF